MFKCLKSYSVASTDKYGSQALYTLKSVWAFPSFVFTPSGLWLYPTRSGTVAHPGCDCITSGCDCITPELRLYPTQSVTVSHLGHDCVPSRLWLYPTWAETVSYSVCDCIPPGCRLYGQGFPTPYADTTGQSSLENLHRHKVCFAHFLSIPKSQWQPD